MNIKTVKLAVLLLVMGLMTLAYAAESAEKEVAFTVGCFDVGATALEGRPGVISVVKGWHGGREINRVLFDPQKASVESMESWLKNAGTYIETEPNLSRDQEKEKMP